MQGTLAGKLPVAPRASSILDIARHRRTDPRSLAKQLRGDLDWIVLKCLEKERARRYETANGLAADLQRHLSDEPVVASPPSARYRFRKFARRNKRLLGSITGIAAALIIGLSLATYGFITASDERDQKIAALDQEKKALAAMAEQRTLAESNAQRAMDEATRAGKAEADAEAARELAEKRQKQTQQVSEFQAAMLSEIDVEAMGRGIKEHLRGQVRLALECQYVGEFPDRRLRRPEEIEAELAAFDQRADPAQAVDVARRVMDEFVLARAAGALEEQFGNQPLVQAQLHFAIGKTYRKLGVYAAAETHLRAALEIRRGHYGPENAHAHVAECLYNLAGVMDNLGSLAVLRTKQGRLPEAEDLNQQVLQLRRDHFGDEHEKTALSLHNPAHVLLRQDRHAEAEELFRESLAIRRAVYGDDHPLVAMTLHYLGKELVALGRRPEGQALYRQALALQRELLGDHHPEVRVTLRDLAKSRWQDGDRDEAIALLREALAIAEWLFPDGDPEAWRRFSSMAELGAALASQARRLLSSDRERALALWEEAESLMSAGVMGMNQDPRSGSLEIKRRSIEMQVKRYEFWHDVAPDGGWDVRAAEWRAELENLPGP